MKSSPQMAVAAKMCYEYLYKGCAINCSYDKIMTQEYMIVCN